MFAGPRHRRELSKHSLYRGMLFSVAALAACLGFIQAAAGDQSADFKQDLAQGYSELASFSEIRTHDAAGQSYFQNKSDRARALYKVDPEWPTNWSVAPDLSSDSPQSK